MTSISNLKDELYRLKYKLETIEEQLSKQSKEIALREDNWKKSQSAFDNVINTQGDRLILNIGGKIFTVAITTILTIRDSFLARIIDSGKINLKEEFFIDRSPKYFNIILDYYRNKEIDISNLPDSEINIFLLDVEYYAVKEIKNYIYNMFRHPIIEDVDETNLYKYNNQVVGTNLCQDLNARNLSTGFCCDISGKFIVKLDIECEVNCLEIGGFNGNKSLWYPDNGANAKILGSLDKKIWVYLGKIPSGFGKKIKKVNIPKTKIKYLKFESLNLIGIGYIKAYNANSKDINRI